MEDRTGRRVGPADVRPLSERERALLRLRYPDGGAPRTLAEVGRALGVSAPRVAQVHDRALNALARVALAVRLRRPVPADVRADLSAFGHLLGGGSALTRRLFVLASLAGLALAAAPAAAAAPDPAARVLDLGNTERAARGLPALAWEPRLADAAADYAAALAGRGVLVHRGADGSDLTTRAEAHGYRGWRFLGENLAAGQATPERVVAQWMASPAHRANVLDARARAAGVGHAHLPASRHRHYWTLEVGG